jgi:hypothetical protein
MASWKSNSQIIHAVSKSGGGPFTKVSVSIPLATNPSVHYDRTNQLYRMLILPTGTAGKQHRCGGGGSVGAGKSGGGAENMSSADTTKTSTTVRENVEQSKHSPGGGGGGVEGGGDAHGNVPSKTLDAVHVGGGSNQLYSTSSLSNGSSWTLTPAFFPNCNNPSGAVDAAGKVISLSPPLSPPLYPALAHMHTLSRSFPPSLVLPPSISLPLAPSLSLSRTLPCHPTLKALPGCCAMVGRRDMALDSSFTQTQVDGPLVLQLGVCGCVGGWLCSEVADVGCAITGVYFVSAPSASRR